MTRIFAALLALAVSAMAVTAEPCRLALALALDVSGSVDQREYRMQMSGLADALADQDVANALFAMPGTPVALAVFEWASSDYQRLIQDWILIRDQTDLAALIARLNSWSRESAPEATGLGAALLHGKALIDRNPGCWAATLDVSGDGKNNDWPTPQGLREGGVLEGMRINGLVIETFSDDPTDGLAAYYLARVIQGADAFVEVARGFEDYARAMRRKLLRELETRPMGGDPEILHRF